MAKTLVRTPKKAKRYTLGRAAFAKISAVEGITLAPEMAEDFRAFDRESLSAEARRRVLVRKYGKVLA
jgi:hypothetical protein